MNEERVFPPKDKVIYLPSSQRSKGKDKAYNDGNSYVDKGVVANGQLRAFVCSRNKCTVRIHINQNGYIVKRINTHTHTRDPTLIQRAKGIILYHLPTF